MTQLVIPVYPDIDRIFSVYGGLVRGHLYEVYGPDGEGKTTLAAIIAGAAQRLGLKVGWVDVEYSLDFDHAKFLGVNMDELDHYLPEVGEDALDKVTEMCNDSYGLVVCDSVGGLVPRAMDETENLGESRQFGQVARLLAEACPKIRKKAYYGKTAVIFINQIRAKIQKFGMGPPTESFGGYSLKHMVSARFEIRRVAWIKYSTDVVGCKLRLRAPKKNRLAPPARDGYIDVIFDHDSPSIEEMNRRRKTKIEPIKVREIED